MAARLVATRLRKRSSPSFLAGIAGTYQHPRAPLVGYGLETIEALGAGPGSRCYSSHRMSGSVGLLWRRSQLSTSLVGFSNLNLASVGFERTTAASGVGQSLGAIHTIRHKHSDEWLVQRALADRRRRQARQKARPSPFVDVTVDEIAPGIHSEGDNILPETPEEERIAGVLGRPDLIITRNVEWANLAFGFEQQNKYVIMDPREPEAPVGYILEDSNVLMRQFLRRRRPFVAHVLDGFGNEICRVRRPIWFINSTIFVEVNGKVIGEAHRRWHLWKRIYDCYLGNQQFAAVENPGFWYWTFTLHDENQGVLAVIDRNWRGFGYEFLTDAGQYVVRFGNSVPSYVPSAFRPQPVKEAVRVGGGPILAGSPTGLNEMQNLRTAAQEAEELLVTRPLSLSERAVVLALAVSLDNDYFSNHSQGIGFIPLPFFGGSEVADNAVSTGANDPQDSRERDFPEAFKSENAPSAGANSPQVPIDYTFPEGSKLEDSLASDDDNVLIDPFDNDFGTDNW